MFEEHWNRELELHKLNRKASLRRALRKSFGSELMVAGVFKALWSLFVILGAYFFIRNILLYVDTEKDSAYDSDRAGYLLMAFFFIDAWLLGKCIRMCMV